MAGQSSASAGLAAAQNEFQKHVQDHLSRFNAFPNALNQAARTDSILSPAQFKIQMAFLDQIASQLAEERRFFLNESADLVRACQDQGLDSGLISRVEQNFNQRNQALTALYAAAFDALSSYQDQVRAFLATMYERREEWNYSDGTELIQFTTTEIHDLYLRETAKLQVGARSVARAFRALTDFKPPH